MITNTVIHRLIDNLNKIRPEAIYANSFDANDLAYAAKLNVDQLNQGQLTTGEMIGTYSDGTVARNNIRVTKVYYGDNIIFKDTGEFHKSIYAEVSKDGQLKLSSKSIKSMLAQDYVEANDKNGTVLGLQHENLKKLYHSKIDKKFKNNLISKILER